MSSPAHANARRSPSQPTLWRRFLKIALWLVAALLLLAALAAWWAWSNRYSIIERQAVTYLGSLGLEAELDIRSADGRSADVRNIRLSQDGERFLTVGRLQAAYQWRDLLEGRVERLDFTDLDAAITVDETGRITDGWVPPSSGGSASSFPVDGIGARKARLRVTTPFGEAVVTGDAELAARDTFEITGRIERADLSRDGATLSVSGPVALQRDAGPYTLASDGLRLSLTHPSGTLRDTRLALDGTVATPDGRPVEADGRAVLSGGRFVAAGDLAGTIERVGASGRWADGRLLADLDTRLSDVRVTDPERRETLARTLSLANALSEVPVAQNFAPGLVAPIAQLLGGASVEATLSLDTTAQRRTLALAGPMRVAADTVAATAIPVEDAPLYAYRSGAGHYDVAAAFSLNRPVPLDLDPLRVRIRSDNGLSVGGIGSATGRVRSQGNWRARTRDGRAARLGPLDVSFDYQSPADSPPADNPAADDPASLTLRGSADYDGDVPGGYVKGLRAGGTLQTRLEEARTALNFQPSGRVRIARLETTSDWTVRDFDGVLRAARPLYLRRDGRPAQVRADLRETTLSASRPASDGVEAASLDLSIGEADLSGQVAQTTQNWDIGFRRLGLVSETFPIEGTDLTLPEGQLGLELSREGRTRFALSAPDSILVTPAYSVRGMALQASGTAEEYTLDYRDGRVRVVPQSEAAQLPVLPASGVLRFTNGRFTGEAQTALPRAPDSPIDVTYSLRDGRGEADVFISDLRFRPRGLQPQDLAPALRGKIAQVDGAVDARLRISFGGDAPLSGFGSVDIKDVALGTAPGPVTGLSGRVELVSLFPVVTAPDQRLSIATFNPGFPLEDGALTYALVPDGVRIDRAVFPLGEGEVSFDPFTWTYGAPENRVTLRVSGVEVGEFLKNTSEGRLTVTGQLEGTIPVVVRGIDVLVEQGRLEVPAGGVIQFRSEQLDATGRNAVAAGGMAIQALRNFEYKNLFLEMNGPLDGDIRLGALFTGSNPDVLYGVPFEFDVSVEGELLNIARNLNPNALQQRILSRVTEEASP
jgi:hypothetical protein